MVQIISVTESSKCPSKCKVGVKRAKINKKLAGGKTAANDTYKYVVRLRYSLDKTWEYEDTRNTGGGCTGVFVSFSDSDPTKCGGRPTKYFFVTAAHCYNNAPKIVDIHYGLSKKSPFYTVRGGSAKLMFEQLRNNLPITNASETNSFAKHIIVDTATNPIKIPVDYPLNIGLNDSSQPTFHADIAFMELSKQLYDQIVSLGGEFIQGETNAYIQDIRYLGNCFLASMQKSAVFKGTQIAGVKRLDKVDCVFGRADLATKFGRYECWEVLGNVENVPAAKLTTYAEGGDSGGPIICNKGDQKEVLMTLVSSLIGVMPKYILTPHRKSLRNFLVKAYYDDTTYKYFPPDNPASIFVATKQTGYIREELKR